MVAPFFGPMGILCPFLVQFRLNDGAKAIGVEDPLVVVEVPVGLEDQGQSSPCSMRSEADVGSMSARATDDPAVWRKE